MAFTSTDLASVEAALLTLATGARVASVTIDGHETIEYSQTSIDKLKFLRDEIASEIQTNANRRRFVLTSTSKGL